MKPSNILIAALVSSPLLMPASGAEAAASRWEETDGGRVRIVTETWQPGLQTLRGILQIDLQEGWKTYWREPGSAGIPPSISIESNAVGDVAIHYPAPIWVDDPYGSWAGYLEPVSLPLTFSIADGAQPGPISANVFLGICKDVCIPFAASFTLDLAEDPSGALHTMSVSAAHAALPKPNSETLSIDSARWNGGGSLEIVVSHASRKDMEPALFISAGTDRPFAKPILAKSDERTSVFTAKPNFSVADAGELHLIATVRLGAGATETQLTVSAP